MRQLRLTNEPRRRLVVRILERSLVLIDVQSHDEIDFLGFTRT